MLRALLLLSLLSIGCAPRTTQVSWTASYGTEHPLVGRIYSARRGAFVDTQRLFDDVAEARWLLLGESHDHPDHHLLQALLLARWLGHEGERRVGFEMLDEDQAPALDPQPATADALAEAVRWADTGWPEFGLYRPIFDVVLAHDARVVAAHPSRQRVRAAMMDPTSVTEDERARLELGPLPEARQQAMDAQIERAHCGYGGEAMVRAMSFGQRYKDAFMANALIRAGAPAALVTGAEHARRDRGVPVYLGRHGEGGVISVGLLQVDDAHVDPADYELEAFDFVWFTPRVSDRDPCDEFREQLERMRARAQSQAR